jgi:hypothetical protein
MTTYIHNADIGTIFRLTITDTAGVVIDVSSASVKYLYFQAPDGTKERKTASFYTDGSDGIIQYTGVSGDIDQTGVWQVQGYVETSDGKFFTEKTTFSVLSNLYVAA